MATLGQVIEVVSTEQEALSLPTSANEDNNTPTVTPAPESAVDESAALTITAEDIDSSLSVPSDDTTHFELIPDYFSYTPAPSGTDEFVKIDKYPSDDDSSFELI